MMEADQKSSLSGTLNAASTDGCFSRKKYGALKMQRVSSKPHISYYLKTERTGK